MGIGEKQQTRITLDYYLPSFSYLFEDKDKMWHLYDLQSKQGECFSSISTLISYISNILLFNHIISTFLFSKSLISPKYLFTPFCLTFTNDGILLIRVHSQWIGIWFPHTDVGLQKSIHDTELLQLLMHPQLLLQFHRFPYQYWCIQMCYMVLGILVSHFQSISRYQLFSVRKLHHSLSQQTKTMHHL